MELTQVRGHPLPETGLTGIVRVEAVPRYQIRSAFESAFGTIVDERDPDPCGLFSFYRSVAHVAHPAMAIRARTTSVASGRARFTCAKVTRTAALKAAGEKLARASLLPPAIITTR